MSLLTIASADLRSFRGMIRLPDGPGGREYAIELANVPFPGSDESVAEVSVRCDPELAELLRGSEAVVRRRIAHCRSAEELVAEIRDVAARSLRDKAMPALLSSEFYARVVEEMDGVGWGRLSALDGSMTRLTLQCLDAAGRAHALGIELPPDYPRSAPKCSVRLPGPFVVRWASSFEAAAAAAAGARAGVDAGGGAAASAASDGRSLAAVAAQFERVLGRYQAVWDELDELDRECWVLEPERPDRSQLERRIAVERFCSVLVELDPERPRAPADVRFLGSAAAVDPLRAALQKNWTRWDEARSVRRNLERVLGLEARGLELPSPATTAREEFTAECGICYAYRLPTVGSDGKEGGGSAIPDIACENEKCGRPFHRTCLYEWLRALPSARQSFDTVFGECPYCSQPIQASRT